MTTVFLSGSRKVSRLPKEVVERLASIIEGNLKIVIGDANGSDRLMQKFLDEKRYRNVEVFHSGPIVRNNLGDWPRVEVEVEAGVSGREFYTRKDKRMAEVADFGFIIWDGKSRGSLTNASTLAASGKKSVVFVVPRRSFTVVRTPDDLQSLSDALHTELEGQSTLEV